MTPEMSAHTTQSASTRLHACSCDHDTPLHGICRSHGEPRFVRPDGVRCSCPTLARRWTEALESMANQAYRIAAERGFHEQPNPLPQSLCLLHSEISEALEAYRDDEPPIRYAENGKPEGVIVELADVLIRLLDTAQEFAPGALAEAFIAKMAYNEGRPAGHGRVRL